MLAALEVGGNASSVHAEGRAARKPTRRCTRDVVALALGALPGMVVVYERRQRSQQLRSQGAQVERMLVSAVEHPSRARGGQGQRQAGRDHPR